MRRLLRSASGLLAVVLALSLGSAQFQPAQAAPPADRIIHIVQPGETLSLIAQEYGLRWPAIQQANQLPGTMIYAGEQLLIPLDAAPATDAPAPASTPNAAPAGIVGALPGLVPHPDKLITVSLSQQRMRVFQGSGILHEWVVSTGEPGLATLPGQYAVQDKIPNAYGANWDLWMPNWLGIYWAGDLENGIHALPILPDGLRLWDGYLGTPVSFGCVILGIDDAQTLYDWAEVGTPVIIQN